MAGVLASLSACGSSGGTGGSTSAATDKGDMKSQTADMGKLPAAGSTIKIICPYGAGGTADAIARKYAEVANKSQKDYTFIVENQTGGDGFAACLSYSEEKADTTDLLIFGYGVCYRHDLGKKYDTEVVDWDRGAMKPIGTIDDRTWILYTTKDQTLESILKKAEDGGIKMSGGNPLSDPHLALGSLLAQLGGKVQCVSGYDGGAEQKQGLLNGEVDVFVGSTQAAQDEVEAGTLVPVLAFSDRAFTGFKGAQGSVTVPSVSGADMAKELPANRDFSGSILSGGGYIATRTGASQAWVDKMTEITKMVWASSDYSDWISGILLNHTEIYGDEAQAHLDQACEKALAAYELLSKQAS